MISPDKFITGLTLLHSSLANAPELTKTLVRFYFGIISASIDDDETYALAIKLTADQERYWPSPGTIVDKVRPRRPETAKLLEGADMFERIVAARQYTPSGMTITEDLVRALFGDAAARAFRALGGTRRFRDLASDTEHFARKDFQGHYVTALDTIASDEGATLIGASNDPRVRALVAQTALRLPAAPPPQRQLRSENP